jgi:hypothetical protein
VTRPRRKKVVSIQHSLHGEKRNKKKFTIFLSSRDVGHVHVPVVLHLIQITTVHFVSLQLQRHDLAWREKRRLDKKKKKKKTKRKKRTKKNNRTFCFMQQLHRDSNTAHSSL